MTSSHKRLLLCIGGKGGVGKTLFCRTLFHFLVAEQVSVLGVDADRENPEFYDYHRQVSPAVERLDFLSVPGLRQLLERLEDSAPQIALVDLPGASGSATRQQFERFDVFHALKHDLSDYQVTIIAVLNNCFNSIGSLNLMMQAFGAQAQYVAVLSDMWTLNHSRFERWRGSSKRETFLELGGIEIEMPLLELEVFDTIHGRGVAFSQQDELGLGDRILLRSFLNRSRAAFAPAGTFLGLPPLTEPKDTALSPTARAAAKKTTNRSTRKSTTVKKEKVTLEEQPSASPTPSPASVTPKSVTPKPDAPEESAGEAAA